MGVLTPHATVVGGASSHGVTVAGDLDQTGEANLERIVGANW
jgi:hypothetical protein